MVDDLQWAEPSTKLLLGHLVRSISGGLVVIGTLRSAGDVAQPSMLLGDPGTEATVEVQRLIGLDASDVGSLVAEHAGAQPPVDLAIDVCRLTGGNPYFVGALLAHLCDVSFLRDRTGQWASHDQFVDAGVPEGVRVVVGRRLGAASRRRATLLEVGAVCGLTFEERLVRGVCGATIAAVIDALDAAAAAGLIYEERVGHFAFTHALVRQGLLDELSLTRTAWLHWRIATQLEQEVDATHGSTRSRTTTRAVPRSATARRSPALRSLAGEHALRQLAFDEAVVHLSGRWTRSIRLR